MDGLLSLLRAHQISDEVEAKLRAAYPNAEVIIHQDPEGIEEPRSNFPRRVAAR
jgi:ferrous-iron efflux pump FieF